jgi:hypothetical protein
LLFIANNHQLEQQPTGRGNTNGGNFTMKWFQHDTNMLRNRKVRKLLREHGIAGYGIWCVLLEKLHAEEGSFQIVADPLWLEDLAEDLKISGDQDFCRVFDTMAEVGLIDRQLWGEKIIYCPAIAERVAYIRSLPRREQGLPPLHRDGAYRRHRDAVFERDGYCCIYCSATEDLTLDHVIPYSKGGSDEPDNLATCCRSCNSRKHARTPQEWLGGLS